MFGVLNVNKPAGITSRDAVNRLQRVVRPAKVGHAGTLDPLASGVLIVCVGPATRLIEYVQRMPKCYRGTFLLGRVSDTEDVDGDVRELPNPPLPTEAEIASRLPQFIGKIMQRPPDYSAVKVAGRRAYKLARAGRAVELASRPVRVDELTIVDYSYPELTLDVCCGSGTYIRSLGRDLAASLNTGAVMASLTRTAIGPYALANGMDIAVVDQAGVQEQLLPAATAVAQLPRLSLSPAEIEEVSHGRLIDRTIASGASEIAAVSTTGDLIAILTPRGPDQLGAVRCFAHAVKPGA